MNGDWRTMLPADPLPWLLGSGEPAARWVALVKLLDRPADDLLVHEAHEAVLAGPEAQDLLGRLLDWEEPQAISGHDSPAFMPNLVGLLADMGVTPDDDPRLGALLDQMLAHSDDEGRFATFAVPTRAKREACWTLLQCDTFAIAEILARAGRGDDPRLRRAVACAAADLAETPQGPAWPCRPEPASGFRGPGRKADCCPMLIIEALRLWSYLPEDTRPARLADAGRVLLRAWRVRGDEKPYMFGHGRVFKTVKWPPTWYGAYLVLDAVGRWPELWRGDEARAEDRAAVAELAACLIAYNVSPDGTVTPCSARKGFELHSFGQKKEPSAWATARVCAVLRRFEDLADEVRAVDVLGLGSSKGGTGTPVPPRASKASP